MTVTLVPALRADDFAAPVLRSRAGKAPHLDTIRLFRALVAEVELGMVVLDVHPNADCFILYEIFLCSDRRNRGLGTRVLAAIEDHVRAAGGSCLEVWPRTLDRRSRSDAQLVRWYGRHGYAPARPGAERLRKKL